jgi:hypothetical protein
MWTDLELLCHANAHAAGGFQSLFSGGAVSIAGIHNQRPHQPLSSAQMLASNRNRRSHDLIAREYGCRGSAVGS